jgi:phosphodiesterase/alkaline phosphatase D-like protein
MTASQDVTGPSGRSADEPLRWVARIWAECAIVGYLLWQAAVPSPVAGEEGYWERLAALAVLATIVVGHLLSWRWEIQGATVMAVGGALLALVTTFRFDGWQVPAAVLAAFTGPAVLYWWIWRRGRSRRAVGLLAALLSLLLVGTMTAALVAHSVAYGTFHPQSDLPVLAPAPVVWAWSGAIDGTSAVVVARVRDPGAQVRLAISTDPGLADPTWMPAAARPADDPALVRFEATGLRPGERYHYAVEVDGVLVTARAGRLRTLPEGPVSFSFALGSCAQVGNNGSVLDRIREADPDLFLITGDFAYEDFWANDRSAFRSMYDTQLTTPAMDALVRAVPVDYVWDDHDFGPNDADSTAASRPAAAVVYRQAVPHPVLAAGEGPESIEHSFVLGRVRFVVTDSRSRRSPKDDPDDADKTMLGAAQVRWLEQELRAAADAGQVVVLVTSVPWNGTPAAGADDWSGYTTARRQVADLVAAAGLTDRLLMVAGDAHMVAIDDGSHTDFSSDGSGGFPLMHAAALDRPGSYKAGPYSEGAHPGAGQFGLVTVTDTGGDITLRLSGRDFTGAELVGYTFTVPAARLAGSSAAGGPAGAGS